MFARTWHVVDKLRLREPPATLWRIQHAGNVDKAVLVSRAAPQFDDRSEFFDMVMLHANWRSRVPTPFLSTFADFRHAENWANQRVDRRCDRSVRIHQVDTKGLLVFRATEDEFLVLHEIPQENVVKMVELHDRIRAAEAHAAAVRAAFEAILSGRRPPTLAEPPAKLWRVEHSGNQDAVFSSRAAPAFASDWDFIESKRQHLNWFSKRASPFVSTFSNQGHALNWARQRVTQMHDPCVQVHEVATGGLLVFGAGGDEFLVLDEIPLANVVHTTSMRMPPVGRNWRRRTGRNGGGGGARQVTATTTAMTPYGRQASTVSKPPLQIGYFEVVDRAPAPPLRSNSLTSSDDSYYGYY